jgi:hypothetical protein
MGRLSILCLALICLVSALAHGQSLGEIARKEAERRAKNKEQGVTAKVIDKNVLEKPRGANGASPQTKGTPALVSAKSETIAATPSKSPVDESEDRQLQEFEWRKRAAQAEARVEAAKKNLETLKTMWLGLGEYFGDEAGRPVITTPEQLQAMTARAQKDLEAAEKALADLHESARRSNTPPGWLRQ